MCVFHRMMRARKTPIVVVVVAYPTTPLVTTRVRFCVSAAHTKDDIDTVLRACDEIGDILDVKHLPGERWPLEQQPRQPRASRLRHQLVPPSETAAAGAGTDDSRKTCKGSYCTSSLPFHFAHISSSQFSSAGQSHLFNPQGQASLPQSFDQPSHSVPSANVQPSSVPSASQHPPPTVNWSRFLLLVLPTCHYSNFVLYAQLCVL